MQCPSWQGLGNRAHTQQSSSAHTPPHTHAPAQSAALIMRELPLNSSGPPAAAAIAPYASAAVAPPTPPLPLAPGSPLAPPPPPPAAISATYQPGRKPSAVSVRA